MFQMVQIVRHRSALFPTHLFSFEFEIFLSLTPNPNDLHLYRNHAFSATQCMTVSHFSSITERSYLGLKNEQNSASRSSAGKIFPDANQDCIAYLPGFCLFAHWAYFRIRSSSNSLSTVLYSCARVILSDVR